MTGGLLVSSIVSGLVPVVNAEVLLIAATVAAGGQAPLVAATVTAGQMIAKAGLFLTARWAPSRLPARARAALGSGNGWIERRRGAADAVILVSAVVGLPPFYAVTVAAGALRVSPVRYFALGTLGRAARFGFLGWAAVQFGEFATDFVG